MRWKPNGWRWQQLGITAKFSLSFGILLALIALVAMTGYVALTTVRHQTQTAISASAKIQRLVLETDSGLQEARRLERDFFLRYPRIGFSAAYRTYAKPAHQKIWQVAALSAQLQHLISASNVSDALRKSEANMNFYLFAAKRYAVSFKEAVDLVVRLAAAETGLETQLTGYSALLRDMLAQSESPDLMILYYRMRHSEKEYMVTRKRPFMQTAFNIALPLRRAMETLPSFGASRRRQALSYLEQYLATAEEILQLDMAIRSKTNEFDLQAEALAPVTAELIALADKESGRVRTQIVRTERTVTAILVLTTLAGLTLVCIISRLLHNSITANVIRLTEVAGKLEAGNLDVSAHIVSSDEIGRLAGSFNAMADRIRSLVNTLEQKVAERTGALVMANTRLRQEIVERMEAEEKIRVALAEKEVLLREIHHRVKNNLTVISSLLDLSTLQTVNPEAIGILSEARARIHTMAMIHARLYQSERFDEIDMGSHLEDIIANIAQIYTVGNRRITPVIECQHVCLSVDQAVPLSLALNEIVSNVFKHAFREGQAGTFTLAMHCHGDAVSLSIRDNGVGLPEDFDIYDSGGTGIPLVIDLVRKQLRGQIDIRADRGTEVVIRFKLDSGVS